MNNISSIVFDLDGTLYQSSDLADEIQERAAEGVALQLKIEIDLARERLLAAKAERARSTGCEATLSAASQLLDCDIKTLHDYLAANIVPEKYLAPDPQVISTLEKLGRRHKLYIYTNNNIHLTGRIMKAIGIENLFAGIFTIEDSWRAKPDETALATIYATIKAEPEECLFAGDRYDVDLRLPESQGSAVFLVKSAAELISMEQWLIKGENIMLAHVKEVLETVRPALQADGGDVELVEVTEDGIVKVKLTGACGHCPMSTMTLKMGIEKTLKEKIPGVIEVIQVR